MSNFIATASIGLLVFHLAVFHVSSYPYTLSEYFPEIDNDLTKVTWEHAVNSKEKLQAALKGDALMLEADIVMGHTSEEAKLKNEPMVPIMAHPPDSVSNLTLEDFLNTFIESKARKGIKLDFKTRKAFAYSEDHIDRLFNSYDMDFPIWLNADIVPGPVNATKEVVDADYFLSRCISKYPAATLSVGWSTRLEKGSTEGSYSQDDINRMTEALNKNMVLVGPVTFAVRAALAARSVDILTYLIKTSTPESTTLTIWSSDPNDVVDFKGLKQLIDNVGRNSVYLDLPKEMFPHVLSQNTSSASRISLQNFAILSVISILIFKLF